MECTKLGLRLVLYGHDRKGNVTSMDRDETVTIGEIERSHRVLGYVVWIHNMPHWWVRNLFGKLAGTGKPVSVLTDGLRTALEQQVSIAGNNARFAFFPLGTGSGPGAHMGRYLIGLGHRSIACFSIDGYGFFEDRILGLAGALSDVRSTCRVFSLGRHEAESVRDHTESPYEAVHARIGSLTAWLSETFPTHLDWQHVFDDLSSTVHIAPRVVAEAAQ